MCMGKYQVVSFELGVSVDSFAVWNVKVMFQTGVIAMQGLSGAMETALVGAIGNVGFMSNPMNQAGLKYFESLTDQAQAAVQDAKPARLAKWRTLLDAELEKPEAERCQPYIDKILEEIEKV